MTPERFAKLQRALDRRQPDLTVFLDAVNKAQNLTAIVRTADAVGIQRLHATSADDALRLHHMIAGSAKHWVAVELHRSARVGLTALRKEGWRIVAAHGGGKTDYRDVDYTKKVALVVGAEAVGLSDALLPWGLTFAAGAMLFVISGEIIPETHRSGIEQRATFSLVMGFILMMMLDVTLG